MKSRSETVPDALTSIAATEPASDSMTRSTSSWSRVRKWEKLTCCCDHPDCFSSSLTANVSTRCPNWVSAAGLRPEIFAWVRPLR